MTEEVKTKVKSKQAKINVVPLDVENVLELHADAGEAELIVKLKKGTYYELAAANGLSKKKIDEVKGFEDKVLTACTETILSVSKDDEKNIVVRERYLTDDGSLNFRMVTRKRSDFDTVQASLHTPFASHHLSYSAVDETLNHKIETNIGNSFQETLMKAELAFATNYYKEHLLPPIENLKTVLVNGLSTVDKAVKMVEPLKGVGNFVEDLEESVGEFLNVTGL